MGIEELSRTVKQARCVHEVARVGCLFHFIPVCYSNCCTGGLIPIFCLKIWLAKNESMTHTHVFLDHYFCQFCWLLLFSLHFLDWVFFNEFHMITSWCNYVCWWKDEYCWKPLWLFMSESWPQRTLVCRHIIRVWLACWWVCLNYHPLTVCTTPLNYSLWILWIIYWWYYLLCWVCISSLHIWLPQRTSLHLFTLIASSLL